MFDYTWIEDVDKGSRVWESKKAGLLMQGVRVRKEQSAARHYFS
jgi:hypothetical protein